MIELGKEFTKLLYWNALSGLAVHFWSEKTNKVMNQCGRGGTCERLWAGALEEGGWTSAWAGTCSPFDCFDLWGADSQKRFPHP